MFAAYIVSALLVALNVLIAMLTNTFEKVSVSTDNDDVMIIGNV